MTVHLGLVLSAVVAVVLLPLKARRSGTQWKPLADGEVQWRA